MKKGVLVIFILCLLVSACQHNDICTENQPSTPKLVIKFYNFDHPDKLKPVKDFNAKEVNSENFYFENNRNDTLIKIPLRTSSSSTTYELLNFKDQSNEKSDIVEFHYSSEEIYINRPCGFRSTFSDIEVTHLENSNSWIKAVEIKQENINDENNPHIYIFH